MNSVHEDPYLRIRLREVCRQANVIQNVIFSRLQADENASLRLAL